MERKTIGKIQIIFGILVIVLVLPWMFNFYETYAQRSYYVIYPYRQDLNLSAEMIYLVDSNAGFNLTAMSLNLVSTMVIIGILGVISILQGLANLKG